MGEMGVAGAHVSCGAALVNSAIWRAVMAGFAVKNEECLQGHQHAVDNETDKDDHVKYEHFANSELPHQLIR